MPPICPIIKGRRNSKNDTIASDPFLETCCAWFYFCRVPDRPHECTSSRQYARPWPTHSARMAGFRAIAEMRRTPIHDSIRCPSFVHPWAPGGAPWPLELVYGPQITSTLQIVEGVHPGQSLLRRWPDLNRRQDLRGLLYQTELQRLDATGCVVHVVYHSSQCLTTDLNGTLTTPH